MASADRALSDDERVARATVLARMHKPDAALEDLVVVLEKNPRHARAHYAAAVVALEEGRAPAAVKHLQTYLVLAPAAADAAAVRALIAELERPAR